MVCCTFSDDGRFFAAGANSGWLTVWQVGDGISKERVIFSRARGDAVQSVDFAPIRQADKILLVVGDRGGRLRSWKLERTRSTWHSDGIHWLGHEGHVYMAKFAPDGSQMVSSAEDGRLKSWGTLDRPRFERSAVLRGDDISFSPSTGILVVADRDEGLYRCDVQTGTRQPAPLPATGKWRAVAISHDGQIMAAGNAHGEILLWNLVEARRMRRWRVKDGFGIARLAFSPNQSVLAVALQPGDSYVHLFEVGTGRELALLSAKQCEAMAFSPDGRQLAAGDWHEIAVYDVATRQRITSLMSQADTVTCLEFGPQGDWLASVGSDRRLVVWDWKTRRQRFSLVAHADQVWALAVSPGGHTIATAGRDALLKLWNVDTGQFLMDFLPDRAHLYKAAFSADGQQLLCLDATGILRIYDGGRLTASAGREASILDSSEHSE
jgi:WD40 repeat protein